MNKLIAVILFLWAPLANALMTPEIYVNEIPDAQGGSYFVGINQPNLEAGDQPWRLRAWGITNQDATDVFTGLSGWGAQLIDKATWDAGLVFEQFPFDDLLEDPTFLFETGANGIGDFDSVFASGSATQAAVFWLDAYFATGLVASSQNFNWIDGPASSTAFAIISNVGTGENLSCSVPVGGPAGALSNCAAIGTAIPLPAAAWLLGSALIGLTGIRYRTK